MMQILEKGERADRCYGLYTEELTDEELQALIDGKRLYMTINYGEYAVVLRYKGKKSSEVKRGDE